MVRSLPAVICGRRVESRGGEAETLAMTSTSVTVPRLTEEIARQVAAIDPHMLDEVSFQEIVSFLNRVGRNWKDREYPRRRLFVRQMQELVGLSEKGAEIEATVIGVLLASHWRMYDMLELELGSRYIIDEWVHREECFARAFPRGRTVHLLAGNVPIAGVASIVRGLLTKNVCIAKLSSGDPVTPVTLALSFLDVDPTHPLARALTVLYWQHGDPLGAVITKSADAVCAWGGGDVIRWARGVAAPEAPVIPFGPRRSVAMVGQGTDANSAALALAHDASVYDQRACFSVRQVFVEGDPAPLVTALGEALERYDNLLPPGAIDMDAAARVALARREDEFFGSQVCGDAAGRWTTVTCPAEHIPSHPLGRTVYVHPVGCLDEAYPYVGQDVQTVAFMPWDECYRHRDALAARGVSRIVELGLNNVFRAGGSHDGIYPLQHLVRFVSTEGPSRMHGKGMVTSLDQTRLLEAGTFGEGFLEAIP